MTPGALQTLWTNVALTVLRDYRARVKYAGHGVTIILAGDRMHLADRETEIQQAAAYLASDDFAEVCANAGMTVRIPALLEYITSAKPAVYDAVAARQLQLDLTPCAGARTMGHGSQPEARA